MKEIIGEEEEVDDNKQDLMWINHISPAVSS